MATQEELAALFAQNMSLQQQAPYVPAQQEQAAPTAEEPCTYYISRHYNHSAHIAAVQQQPSRPASEPPQTDQLTTTIILSRHGVDYNALSHSQIELFRNADASQQMRLIELWRIAPPDHNSHAVAQDLGALSTTSLQQEEAMAKMRYERQIMEERMSRMGGDMQGMDSDAMSDASTNQPLTPIQGGDGRWSSGHHNAEPYMASGYEALAQREYEQSAKPKDIYSHFGTAVGGPNYNRATDPVYKSVADIHKFPNVGGDWTKLVEQKQLAMENQYGAFQQQFQHNDGGVTAPVVYQGEDEEML